MLLVLGLFFLDAWLSAYLSPSESVLIKVNDYGEALPELIFLILTAPFILYHVYYSWHMAISGEIA